MFCYQCKQTAKGEACTKIGVCGKQPDVAALQDLLIYSVKGLSLYAIEGLKQGINDAQANKFTCEAIFSTLTNVDFDPDRFVTLIEQSVEIRENIKSKIIEAGGQIDFSQEEANFQPADTTEALVAQGEAVGINSDPDVNPDILSLRELLI